MGIPKYNNNSKRYIKERLKKFPKGNKNHGSMFVLQSVPFRQNYCLIKAKSFFCSISIATWIRG